ncbi:hypothetical protein [Saccharothrix deserti]|uniref:hypothetical protein n=1 Tax=Saccharothrix deserti TaxID=2593674 RepID=UPI00131A8824|nr:hypothetical protein [Saccharothrix deserti]
MVTRPKSFAVLLAAFALTGCTATTSGEARPELPPRKERPATQPKPELSERATAPGTVLKLGEQGVIPVAGTYAAGLIGLTVTVDSAPATQADIDGLPLKDKDKAELRGKTFFFIRQHVVNLDGTDLTDMVAPSLVAWTAGGDIPGMLLGGTDGKVGDCEDEVVSLPEFSEKGASFDQCRLVFGEPGDPVASVRLTSPPYDSAKPVTWQQ